MPLKPGDKQISKPPQRKSRLSSRGLQLAVGLSAASTASAASNTASDAAATTVARAAADPPAIAASPPSSRLSSSGGGSVPDSEAHMAQGGQYAWASSHSASSTCTLPSPSFTNEASPAAAHAQGQPNSHSTRVPAESAPVLHPPYEDQKMDTTIQATSDHDGDLVLQRLDNGMPTPTADMTPVAPPLHIAMFEAIGLMKTRIQQLEADTVIATRTEKARYGMLLGACHNMDPVFLILHQQYCCWMIDRSAAYARFPIQPTVIDMAFGELYKIFQDGERLSPPHRLWCSRYPRFGDDVVGLDRVYCQVREFIMLFAMRWPLALAAIKAKNVPVMAFQIRDWFSCTSPTIASTLFTYIRRVIGVPNGPLGVEINQLFNMDNCQERAFGEQNVSPEEMAGIRSTVLRSYMAVVHKARMQQARLAAVPAANSQGVPGLVPASGSTTNINNDTNTDANVNTNTNTNENSNITSVALTTSQHPQPFRPLQGPEQEAEATMARPQPHQALPHGSPQASPTGCRQTSQAAGVPGPPGPPVLEHQNFVPSMVSPRDEPLPHAGQRPRQHQHQNISHPSPPLPSPPQPQQCSPTLSRRHSSLPQQPGVPHHPSPPLPPPPPPPPYAPHPQHPSPPQQPQEPHRPQHSAPAPRPQQYPSPQHRPNPQNQPQSQLAQHAQTQQSQQRPHDSQRPQFPQDPQQPQQPQHPQQSQNLQQLHEFQLFHRFLQLQHPQHPEHLRYVQWVRNLQQQQQQQQMLYARQQSYAAQHPQQQQNHGNGGIQSHVGGPNPWAMQNPPPRPQNIWLPPSGHGQQRGVQGDGGQHHQPSSLPPNGPPPSLSRPQQQGMPAVQTLQTSQAFHGSRGSEEHQDRQGQSHAHSGPQPTTTPQPVPRPRVPVQVLQAPNLHHVQAQRHARDQQPVPAPRPGSTSSQPVPQFTTHPLPSTEHPQSQHDCTSVQASLHLTGLRSPRRISSSPGPGAQRHVTRYYQFLTTFAVEPREIPPHMGVTVLDFDVSQGEADRLCITSRPPPSPLGDPFLTQLPMSRHFRNSLRYRLRMCISRKVEGPMTVDAATWSPVPTHWPPHIFISVNEEIMHVRRKQHFHHDLPLELTDSLFKGTNKVKVNLPQFPQNLRQDIVYLMAVERVVTLDHDTVWDMVTSGPHFGAEETKKEICRRLRALDTDDIIIESDVLAVSVADLFSSTLFDVPVRGRKCLHLECFDLGNWLISRPSKPSPGPGEPSMVDCWGCPLCGLDARPCNLQVDDFFADVAKTLLAGGKTSVKKIEVLADGSWTAIGEVGEGEELSDSECAQRSPPRKVKVQESTPDAAG